MGQQQLLLIVLGVILVGISIILGITFVNAYSASSNRDAILHDCQNVASISKSYFGMPKEMGGGGRSFNGFTIPEKLKSTANGTFSDPEFSDGGQSISLTVEGKEIGEDNTNKVKVKATVNSQGDISVTTIN